MGIAVLGPLELDGTTSTLGLRDRVVLEALAVRPGAVVRAESLAEAIWGETPPPSWPKVVQGCVSRLRKTLGGEVIETAEHGYRLRVHVDHVDHLRFERLVGRGRELLALGEPERSSYLLQEALDLWRGEPFSELDGWAPGLIELERLVELHHDAEELHVEALLRSGHHQVVLGPAARLVREAPFRERRWGLLALAQYQDGRQRDALDTLQRARTVMVTELGLDPGPALSSLEQAILRQDPSLAVQAALPEPSAECPYPGLMAYDIRDAGSFFGREAEVAACLAHLDAGGALAIVGASGSGKSSLARAGVAAALERDGRRVEVLTPGRHPMDALHGAARRRDAVLVVDQCEEVLAPEVDAAERAHFLAALADIAGRGLVILTLRADRLGEVTRYPVFAHLVERGLHLLGPMDTDALRRAIEGPAEQAGLRLEPGLVDLLVREVEGAPGALPLLSHVLRQTWSRREGNTMTVAGYTATGGIQEAVSQSAEAVFRGMTGRQQAMLRDLMLRLVVPTDSGDPVRTRAPRRSVAADAEHEAVIESLVVARLVSSDGDSVEIAHEALVMAWPRLRSWLDDDVEGLRIMRHLAVAADSWQELGRPPGELYRGPRQAKAEQWRTATTPTLTPTERDFLDESAALAEAEARATEDQVRRERRSNRRLRAGLAAAGVLLAVSVVAGALAKTAADLADEEAVRAEEQSVAADARRLGAEALRTRDPDLALLLAVAGTRLDDSPDTRNNLSAALDRAPELIGVARTTEPIDGAVRPDGRVVATTGWDAGVSLFDVETREEVARNHDIPLYGVRFNPNGTQLAAAVNPSTPSGERRVDPLSVRMLDPETAALADTQLGGLPEKRVVHTALGFSSNGRWLAAGFAHPTQLDTETWVRVWDTGDLARPVAAFTVPFLAKEQLAVADDGTRVYLGDSESVSLLDAASGRVLRSAPAGAIALSADGSTLVAVRGREIALLDPERLTVKSTIQEDGGIDGLVLSPRADKVGYTVDDTLVVRSLADPDAAPSRLSGAEAGFNGIGFSPDGRTFYSRGGGRLWVWDLVGDRRFVRSPPVESPPDSVEIFEAEVSPDGRTVANLVIGEGESFGVHLLDVESGTRTPQSALRSSNAYYVDLAWRPDGAVVASAQNDHWVDLWDGVTGKAAGRHRVPDRFGVVDSVKFSGDSTRLVVGTHLGWVYSVDASTLGVVGTPVQVKARVPTYGLAANADGSRAIVWIDRRLQLLDLSSGRVLVRADPGFDVTDWAWSADGTAVVVLGRDPSQDGQGTIAQLDPESLTTRSGWSGPQVVAGSIQFSPDGQRFTTSGSERVGLWDTRTTAFLGSVRSDEASLAGFAPKFPEVLIASPSGEVSVWNPGPEAAVRAACRIASREMTEAEWRSYLPERARQQVCRP
ncbi:BTAD domain-containing putative transcriptional regulator [Fodinibacter luteus]|uniref:nSTAND1 domain-containing NTPase n=1 Tax=Fodinibacter luteus TaxID=552064 RepID=UPI0031E94C00